MNVEYCEIDNEYNIIENYKKYIVMFRTSLMNIGGHFVSVVNS